MIGNSIFLGFVLLCVSINGQNKDNDRDGSLARYMVGRTSKGSFETQFVRGRCPQRFYQLNEECVYFANDGKSHAWRRVENICSGRIARMLEEPSAGSSDQPNMQPTNGVRQLVLNTPEKTEILRGLFRDYQEQNFAVRLPSDYSTLARCYDGQDDKWPQFCSNSPQNSTCFETISNGPNDICLREVDCNSRYLRLACEFTLPGSSELTSSTFRTCPQIAGRRRRLPKWAWIAIIVGSVVLLLILLAVIFTLIRKSRGGKTKKQYYPEVRPQPEKVVRLPPRRGDRPDEPILTGAARKNDDDDTGYLQPRSSATGATANA